MTYCMGIRLNLSELEAKEISLPGGFKLILVGRPGKDIFAFSNDNGAEAIFSRNVGRVFGTFQTDKGESFLVESCSKSIDDCHILIKQNFAVLTKLNEKDDVLQPKNNGVDYTINLKQEALEQQGKDDSTTEKTYSLKVYYTFEFRDAVEDVTGFIKVVICSSVISF